MSKEVKVKFPITSHAPWAFRYLLICPSILSHAVLVLPIWLKLRPEASAAAKHLKPFVTEDIKILLLENVNQTGRDILAEQGYQEYLATSLSEDELINKIRLVSQLRVLLGLWRCGTARGHGDQINYSARRRGRGSRPCTGSWWWGEAK